MSSGPRPARGPLPGGTVRVGLPEIGSLDPAGASGASALSVLKAACSGITELDPASGRPEPGIAESWTFKPGARKLTLRLKRGQVFSDGTPVNSQAVRESLSRVARPGTASPWSGLVSSVEGFGDVQSGAATHLTGVEAVEPLQVDINLTRPFSDLPTVLSHPALTPVSLESLQSSASAPDLPVCSGPYRISTGGTAEVKLERLAGSGRRPSPAMPAAKRPADTLILKNFDNQEEAYEAFRRSEVDVAPVPESEIAEAQDRPGYERQPGGQTALLAFDTTGPPTNDPAVRQAISLAVDRLVVIDAAFPDRRPPALRWLSEGFGPEPGPSCGEFIRKVADPDKAKQRLAESAYRPGEPIKLYFDTAEFSRLVAQAIEVQVRDASGVDLTPQALDGPEFETSLTARSQGAVWLMNTAVELPIPDELIGSLFASGSSKNLTGFSDPEVDSAIEKARAAAGPAEAVRLWQQAENEVCKKMPATPLWRASDQWIRDAAKIRVHDGPMLDISGSPRLAALSETPAKPRPPDRHREP